MGCLLLEEEGTDESGRDDADSGILGWSWTLGLIRDRPTNVEIHMCGTLDRLVSSYK